MLKNLKDLSSKKARLEELTVIAEKARDEHLKVQEKLGELKTEYDLMKHEKNNLENDGEWEWDIYELSWPTKREEMQLYQARTLIKHQVFVSFS